MVKYFYEDDYCKFSIEGSAEEVLRVLNDIETGCCMGTIGVKEIQSFPCKWPGSDCDYYYLDNEDRIRYGDQFQNPCSTEWNDVTFEEVGNHVYEYQAIFRRRQNVNG